MRKSKSAAYEIIQSLLDQDMTIKISNSYYSKNAKEDPKRSVSVEVSYYGQYNCSALEDSLDRAVEKCAKTVKQVLTEQVNKLTDKLKSMDGIE